MWRGGAGMMEGARKNLNSNLNPAPRGGKTQKIPPAIFRLQYYGRNNFATTTYHTTYYRRMTPEDDKNQNSAAST